MGSSPIAQVQECRKERTCAATQYQGGASLIIASALAGIDEKERIVMQSGCESNGASLVSERPRAPEPIGAVKEVKTKRENKMIKIPPTIRKAKKGEVCAECGKLFGATERIREHWSSIAIQPTTTQCYNTIACEARLVASKNQGP